MRPCTEFPTIFHNSQTGSSTIITILMVFSVFTVQLYTVQCSSCRNLFEIRYNRHRMLDAMCVCTMHHHQPWNLLHEINLYIYFDFLLCVAHSTHTHTHMDPVLCVMLSVIYLFQFLQTIHFSIAEFIIIFIIIWIWPNLPSTIDPGRPQTER